MVSVLLNFEFNNEQIDLIKRLGEFEEIYGSQNPNQILRSIKYDLIKSLFDFQYKNQKVSILHYDNDHGSEDFWLSLIGKMIYNELKS